MNRSAAAAQSAMHFPGTLAALHRYWEFGREVSIQTASFDIRLHVGWHGEDEGTVCGFRCGAGFVWKMRQLQVHIAVGGVGMNVSAGLKDFDVAVHGVQVFHGFDAGNAQRAVHRADVLDAGAVRNMDSVIHGHFHALVLRIARGDCEGVRPGVNLDGNKVQIGLFVFGGLYRVDFDLVALPSLHVNSPVDVLQFQGTAGLQRIGLIELLADGGAGNDPNNGYKQYTQSSGAESWTKHDVLPPSSTCYQREPRTRNSRAPSRQPLSGTENKTSRL